MGTVYDVPDCMYVKVPGMSVYDAHRLAAEATAEARRLAPKGSTGAMAKRLVPYWGKEFFGVRWIDQFVWFQEHGSKPFTMKSLAGKTIPMWIKDPTGKERHANPKAKTRVRKDGVTEVLIFRKAAALGSKKTVKTKYGNHRSVPASYPGAAGRIVNREARHPNTTAGKAAGAIASAGPKSSNTRNVGVRWRHPGLVGRHFLAEGIRRTANHHGVPVGRIVARHPNGQEELMS